MHVCRFIVKLAELDRRMGLGIPFIWNNTPYLINQLEFLLIVLKKRKKVTKLKIQPSQVKPA